MSQKIKTAVTNKRKATVLFSAVTAVVLLFVTLSTLPVRSPGKDKTIDTNKSSTTQRLKNDVELTPVQNKKDLADRQQSAAPLTEEQLIGSVTDFSISLFQKSIGKQVNTLISPLSVLLGMSMSANGANGNTLSQMEQGLYGSIPLEQMNEGLSRYLKNLPSEENAKLQIANSIWLKNDDKLKVHPDYLQRGVEFFHASIFQSAFNQKTVDHMNRWVKEKTNGLIPKTIDHLDPNTVFCLINTVFFDAKWQKEYKKHAVNDGVFLAENGQKQNVKMMHSAEDLYLEDDKACGFIKPYQEGYSFAALLPNEGVSINDYIATLTGEKWLRLMKGAKSATVFATMPKFKFDYVNTGMSSVLQSLGITDAFRPDKADFSKLGTYDGEPLYISSVIHKATITVDELGTKAGAVTVIQKATNGAIPTTEDTYEVILDRPFIFAIIDHDNGLPLFFGILRVV